MSRANGAGSINYDKRRKRHRARITLHTTEGARRKELGYYKTRQQAQEAITEALSRYGRRIIALDAERVTVAEYLEDWLRNTHRLNINHSHYLWCRHATEHKVNPYIGSLKLAEVKTMHVRVIKQELLDQGFAAGTVSHVLAMLSTAFRHAVADELISRNPITEVGKPKDRSSVMRVYDAEEVSALIRQVAGTEREAKYRVAAILGLRQGELSALHWSDINFSSSLLFVRRSVRTERGTVWGSTKTGAEREILMPPSVAESLSRHRKIMAEKRLAAPRWSNDELVFANATGDVWPGATHRRHLARDQDAAGLPEIRFHDLRHTAATLLLANGMDVRTVADILGHTDPAMTLRKYAHVLPDMRQRAARIMESYSP